MNSFKLGSFAQSLLCLLVLFPAFLVGQNLAVPSQTVTSGTVSYDEDGTITANMYNVSGSAVVRFTAGTQVILQPGFTAVAGSAPITFHANIGGGAVTITGTVTLAGSPLPGVTITLSGDAFDSQVTNSNGSYSFTLISGGTYGVTPSLSSYTFSPPIAAFWSVTANRTASFVAASGTQGPFTLNPTPPSKEYIYVNGQAVAVENWQ